MSAKLKTDPLYWLTPSATAPGRVLTLPLQTHKCSLQALDEVSNSRHTKEMCGLLLVLPEMCVHCAGPVHLPNT